MASATVERDGPFDATEGETGMRNHIQVTPYHFTLVIEGPGAPAELDCTLLEVRQKCRCRILPARYAQGLGPNLSAFAALPTG